ncbi:MAG: TIM barrel protein [Rhizobiaceae bacterium]
MGRPDFALNHMTVARLGFEQFIAVSQRLGCVGVECRNDLPGPLFDGMRPSQAGDLIQQAGLRLLALAEVKRFNCLTEADLHDVLLLLDIAAAAGAESVALIPANDGLANDGPANDDPEYIETSDAADQSGLASAIELIAPHLQQRNLIGLIEPLGFATCAVRYKQPVVELLNSLGQGSRFKLVHDTFHHHVAGDPNFAAAHTGVVHLSGVKDKHVSADEMRDLHRGLVDQHDQLNNITQIQKLLAAGYDGAFSFEAFSPALHAEENPFDLLAETIQWIDAALLEEAA